jgi:mannose-1-phosphate guanylyltransferase
LAGGEGVRLSQFVLDRFGERRPKQYCSFIGERSMLEHTWERAVRIAGADRVVTVIGRGHGRYFEAARAPLSGLLVEQPANLDTAPGIFLPLSYIMAHDPEATVLVFPSDHFIEPNDVFASYMEEAAELAERMSGRVILTAAAADHPETEYGWIQPGATPAGCGRAASVLKFHEKPDARAAGEFFRRGYLWNTFNMAVKAKTLWALGWEHLPGIMDGFEALRAVIGLPEETAVLQAIYGFTEPKNFSTGILEKAIGETLVLSMDEIHWSDWGRPERIEETIGRRTASVCA